MPETDSTNEATLRARSTGRGPAEGPGDGSSSSRGWDAVTEHISAHRMDFVLAVTRALTVLCTVSYIIGFPGSASNRYKQALLMTAATSSLRLHQRINEITYFQQLPFNQLSRTYFLNLIREDSFHYLIFPLMFFTGHPIALALLPCSMYATFNLAVYAIAILDKLGDKEHLKTRIARLIRKYEQSMLQTVALCEVALMAIVPIGVFANFVGIYVPVLYCIFFMLRFNSPRIVYLKLLVSQIKVVAQAQVARFSRR